MHETPRSPSSAGGPDWDALARFAAGESDPAESARVEQWLADHPGDQALVTLVREHGGEPHEVGIVDTERALRDVRTRIAGDGTSARPVLSVGRGGAPAAVRAAPRRAASPWRPRAFAAAALVLVAVGYTATRRTASTDVMTAASYETRTGERDTIDLVDGSRVVLAPGSRLTVAADFAASRRVTLDGAAYFIVTHDAAHPFTVHAGRAVVRDIGTRFSVAADAAGAVVVAVTEGIVALGRDSASSQDVELRAGDRGVLPATDGPVAVARGVVRDEDVSWTGGALVYRDAPLAVVQADVGRWYGLVLQADSAIGARTITARLSPDSADAALTTLSLVLGAELARRGDTVTLRDAGAARVP